VQFLELRVWIMIPTVKIPYISRRPIPLKDCRSPACITIKQCWSLDHLLSISASFAFESIMRVTNSLLVELEQLSKIVAGEMTLSVFGCIDDTGGQILLGAPVETRNE
jgi:hypothetical protein